MARKGKKSVKNEKKLNSSVINTKKGGKVIKKQTENNSKKKVLNDKVKCPKCSKFISNISKSNSVLCAACLKKEVISSEKTKRNIAKSKHTLTPNLKQSTQVREPSRRSKSSSNLINNDEPKPNLKSSRIKTSQKSPKAIKIQASSTSKRKGSDVIEKPENKRRVANVSKTSPKPSKLDKKESLVSNTKKTGNNMSLRGRKRSYAQLASGIKIEDENETKKRKNSDVNKGIVKRNSRNKKPTVKGSEWLNTIHSKKSISPKQDKIKKSTIQPPVKSKSPKSKTISPVKGRKTQSPKSLSANTKVNTSRRINVSQISKRKSLAVNNTLKNKEPPKPTNLKNKSPKATTSTKRASAVNLSQSPRNKFTNRRSRKQNEKTTLLKECNKTLKTKKIGKLSDSLIEESDICLNDESRETKESVLVVQDILHEILNSVHCPVNSDLTSGKESMLDTVEIGDVKYSTVMDDNRIRHPSNTSQLENNGSDQAQERIQSRCSSNSVDSGEQPRNPIIEIVREDSSRGSITNSAIENIMKTDIEIKDGGIGQKLNNTNEGGNVDTSISCNTTLKSDEFITKTDTTHCSNIFSNKSSINNEVSSDNSSNVLLEIEGNSLNCLKNNTEVDNDTNSSSNIETNCKSASKNDSVSTDEYLAQNTNTNEPMKNEIKVGDSLVNESMCGEKSCSEIANNLQTNLCQKDSVMNGNSSKNSSEDIKVDITNCVEDVNQENDNTIKQNSLQEQSDYSTQAIDKQLEIDQNEIGETLTNVPVNKSTDQSDLKEGNNVSVTEEVQSDMDCGYENNLKNSEDKKYLKEDIIDTPINLREQSIDVKPMEEIKNAVTSRKEEPFEGSNVMETNCKENSNKIREDENNLETPADQKLEEINQLNENVTSPKEEPVEESNVIKTSIKENSNKIKEDENNVETHEGQKLAEINELDENVTPPKEEPVEESNVIETHSKENSNKIKEDENDLETPADQKLEKINQLDENKSNEKNDTNFTEEEKGSNQENNIVVDITANKTISSVDAQTNLEKNSLESSEEKHIEESNDILKDQNCVSSKFNNCGKQSNILEVFNEKCFNKENGLNLETNFPSTTSIDSECVNEHQVEGMHDSKITVKEINASEVTEEKICNSPKNKCENEKGKQINLIHEKLTTEVSLHNMSHSNDQSKADKTEHNLENTEQDTSKQEILDDASLLKCNKGLSNNVERLVSNNKDTEMVVCENDTKGNVSDVHKNCVVVAENTSTLNISIESKENQNDPYLTENKSDLVCCSKEILPSGDVNKSKLEQGALSEVAEHTISETTKQTTSETNEQTISEPNEQSVSETTERNVSDINEHTENLDEVEQNQLSDTSITDSPTSVKEQIPFEKSASEEVVQTSEEMDIQLSISNISKKADSTILQSGLSDQEIKICQEQNKEIQPDSSSQANVEFSEITSEKGQSHEEKSTLSKSQLGVTAEPDLVRVEQFVKEGNVILNKSDITNIEESAKCEVVSKSEGLFPEETITVAKEKEEIRENNSYDVLSENDNSKFVSSKDTDISLVDKTVDNASLIVVQHAEHKLPVVQHPEHKLPELDKNHQSENNTSSEHINTSVSTNVCEAEEETHSSTDKTFSDTTVSGTQKDEEMLVDDQTILDQSNISANCSTKFISEEIQNENLVSSSNDDFNSASENHIDIDIENCRSDQVSSKMDELTNDSISVDDVEGESMQCNSETHSSNRMSVDEDNVIMDLDPDDTTGEVDVCPPTFETKLRNELNMEVS
ncbi:putative leucine-rich repeat-containing protein DDB_G0290503 isoform X1 [Homalodisca vitripennis]|uniref:putative leucine-rich repeat-containing protein DDB_G0290503 isoform X1 n=1 Tax=Homalodisca vitripennis TaxID=197043 RepID=UPI001EEAFC60|nr:putative leucine-rich repeat-containing protein DDB_G0290503 isoform X1 [Homalodisca vitripennis]